MARPECSGPPDEKITINLGPVDLGRIDLLVDEGSYGSRTDFIRDAIRSVFSMNTKQSSQTRLCAVR